MPIFFIYLILIAIFFLGSASYPRTYSKEEVEWISILFFRPFLILLLVGAALFYLVFKYGRKKFKRRHE